MTLGSAGSWTECRTADEGEYGGRCRNWWSWSSSRGAGVCSSLFRTCFRLSQQQAAVASATVTDICTNIVP